MIDREEIEARKAELNKTWVDRFAVPLPPKREDPKSRQAEDRAKNTQLQREYYQRRKARQREGSC